MAITKDIVGKKLDRFDFTVERGKIKEFCLAINEKNPIYFSVEEAKKAGYSDVPAPPTFPTVIMFWGYPKIWNDMAELGIDLPNSSPKRRIHISQNPLSGQSVRSI